MRRQPDHAPLRCAGVIFKANYQFYILMLPAVAATFVFAYMPMYGLQIAFRSFRTSLGIWGSEWVGLAHFQKFVTHPTFWPMIRNTLTITLYSLCTFPLPILLGLLINEIRGSAFKRTVQMISYAPFFLSTVVVCGLVVLFLARSNGIVNNVIAWLGCERIDFLARPSLFAGIYVWSGVWQNVGFDTIIYLAALSSVSPELVEAARIDGANRVQIIRHVNVPAIFPTITILFILSTGGLLSIGYEKILLLENELNREASNVISAYVYRIGLRGGQFSYGSAINLFNTVVNLAILLAVNAVTRRVSEVSLW